MHDLDRVLLIRDEVFKYLGVNPAYCMVETRRREIVNARQITHYFSKKYTKLSLAHIGSVVGGKDHCTVLHSIKTVNNLIETDKIIKSKVEALDSIIDELITKFTYSKVKDKKRQNRKHYNHETRGHRRHNKGISNAKFKRVFC